MSLFAVEDDSMKIVHHDANDRFGWLISEHWSANPSREAIFMLSAKYKRFTFVLPVLWTTMVHDFYSMLFNF